MAKYCDPKELEYYWLSWILSYKIPKLDDIRSSHNLLTKKISDNRYRHCIPSSDPFYFESDDGNIEESILHKATMISYNHIDYTIFNHLTTIENYHEEIPRDESWGQLTRIFHKLCSEISLNFYPKTEQIKNDLIQEAYCHILDKLNRGKLMFKPGKAPAFNLITTAIFRVMYSIKNKEKRQRENKTKFVNNLTAGPTNLNYRSLKVSQSTIGNA